MSENGTKIKRKGKKTFSKLAEASELAHGDVLRIGDVELVVCILPRVAKTD